MTKSEIFVSICCITYNHAQYIRQCLDGFLMAQTSFGFEILIHDDASTDGTEEIIREYEAKYPEIIKPLYETENQWIKGRRGSVVFNFPRAEGKYIALCEGDDYWTDPLKLQKQVDFLEANPEYSLIHTDHDYKDEVKNQLYSKRWLNSHENHFEETNCAPLLISDQYKIATCTVLARTDVIRLILEKHLDDFSSKYRMGDNQLWFHLSRYGKLKYLSESTATYRRHEAGVTALFDVQKRYSFIKNVYWQKRSFAERYGYIDVIPEIDKKYLFSLCLLSSQLNIQDDYKRYFSELRNLDGIRTKEIIKLKLIRTIRSNSYIYSALSYLKNITKGNL